MSACSVAIGPSRYRQYALLLAGLWLSVTFMLLPLTGQGYLWAGLLLTLWFYLLFAAWPHSFRSAVLCLDKQGAVQWLQVPFAAGQLSHRSLITHWLLLIEWQDRQGQQYRFWLFKDQVTAQDYRVLARQLQLQRWRSPAIKDL